MPAGQGTILRADDLLVLGIGWVGMEPEAMGPGESPALRATAERARLLVTLPPQHIAEQPATWTWWGPTWHPLHGSLPPGAPIAPVVVDMGRMYSIFVGEDGNSWANRWVPDGSGNPWGGGWALEGPIPGASFRPWTPMAWLTPDGVTAEVYAIDAGGTLCGLGITAEGALTGWFPVDGGTGEATGFVPGGQVEVAFAHGQASVLAVRADVLMHWRAGAGLESVRQLPTAGRFSAGGVDGVFTAVVWVHDDGQLVIAWWDGTGWHEQVLGAPPVPAPLSARTPLEVAFPSGFVFLTAHPGILWGASMSPTTGAELQTIWRMGDWSMLASGFQPEGDVTALAHVLGGGTRHLVGASDINGAARAVTVRVFGASLEMEADEEIGDWFPPGSPIGLMNRGALIEAFAAGADRTPRHAGRGPDGWWTVPAGFVPIERYGRRPANLSGPSRLAFEVPAGDRVVLTAEGVLAAMGRLPVAPWPAAGTPAVEEETVIELPWGLFASPHGTVVTRAAHREGPARSQEGVVEPWQTRLGSGTGRAGRPGAATMQSLCARDDPSAELASEPFTPPLGFVQREAITIAGREAPFTADRLALGALGGWLTAAGSWPSLEWEHQAVAGRDLMVRTVQRGVLYPLGHEVTYEQLTRRRFDPRSPRSVAVLHQRGTLHVRDPLRRYGGAAVSLAFPFDEAELAEAAITNLDPPSWEGSAGGLGPYFFWPRLGGEPVRFPVILRNAGGEVATRLPALFVAATATGPALATEVGGELAGAYATADRAAVPGTPVRLTERQSFEVHELQLTADPVQPVATDAAGAFLPRIAAARIGLPAVRELAKEAKAYAVAFTAEYLSSGVADRLFDVIEDQIDVDFGGVSDRAGGMATPSFAAQAISGLGAPLNTAAAVAGFDPSRLFGGEAKLLGIVSLKDVVKQVAGALPPAIRTALDGPPQATLAWDAELQKAGPLRPIDGETARLSLRVEATAPGVGPPRTRTTGDLTGVCLDLGALVVSFRALRFASVQNEKPSLKVEGLDIRLAGDLSFLAVLQQAAEQLTGEVPVTVDSLPDGIAAGYHLEVPSLTLPAGVFSVSISDLVFHTSVVLPFDGQFTVDLGFSSRRHPFRVGVWVLGGGGYLEMKIREGRLSELIAAVEIGGLWRIDWVLVAGEVHALAGIEIRLLPSGGVELTGYLRVGGTVSVLALVSVSIEVSARIMTTFNPVFRVVASARLVIEVDLFLVSTGVDLQKEITIYEEAATVADRLVAAGAMRLARGRLPEEDARAAWEEYRAAFRPATVP